MYLKKLELKGFKSFADLSGFNFTPGITALVGPNGTGKSNITDALRWVLGETSTRALRQNLLSEVIFGGSQHRPPAGMAQVTAVFDNSDCGLPLPVNEISVTRKVFRDGSSDFLINNQSRRLKDIQELFMGTGLGRGGITILAEREVNCVLSPDPQVRKMLLEEFSGIAKFIQRKREAEKKLLLTRENLTRLQDIKREVEQELKLSERQLKKLKRYLEGEKQYLEVCKSLLCDEVKDYLLKKQTCLKEQTIAREKLNLVTGNLSAVVKELSSLKDERLKQEEKWANARTGLQETLFLAEVITREKENLKKKREKLDQELKLSQAEQAKLEAELSRLSRQIASDQAELKRKSEEYKKSKGLERQELLYQKGLLFQKAKSFNSDLKELENELAQIAGNFKQLKSECSGVEAAIQKANTQREQLKAEKDLKILQKIQKIKQDLPHLPQICGLLLEYLKIPEQLKLPLEVALGEQLYSLILEKEEQIPSLLNEIKERRDQVFTLWSRETLEQLSFEGGSSFKNHPEVVGEILDLISVAPEAGQVMRALLGGALLVKNLAAAFLIFKLAKEKGEQPPLLITTQGEVLSRQGSVSGGKKSYSLLFAGQEINRQAIYLKAKNLDLKITEEELLAQIKEKQAKVFYLNEKLKDLEAKRESLEAKLKEKALELEKTTRLLKEIEKTLEKEHTLQQETFKAQERKLQNLQEQENQQKRAGLLLSQKIENLNEELKNTEFGQKALDLKAEKNLKDREILSLKEKELKEIYHSTTLKLQALQKSETAISCEKEKAVNSAHQVELKLTEINTILGEKEKDARSLGVNLKAVSFEELPAVDRQALQKEKEKWSRFINSLEGVNLGAEENYQRLKGRFEELNREIEDLEQGLIYLDQLIKRLESHSARTFFATFNRLKEEFSRTFKELFGGGSADLILTEAENPLESGVNIIARPPGKRLQSLTSLSTGEKALTAIAFLFALLKVKPCPFVLLDELDAPLDDANVEKVMQVLEQNSQNSQFIIITHNRRTMEVADQLYGLTMEELGVSKVVKVSLQEPALEGS